MSKVETLLEPPQSIKGAPAPQSEIVSHIRPTKCQLCLKQFSLNGPFNYAFIYGSWEIIKARKVGTTHTFFDNVVYRLLYVVILVGVILFALIKQVNFLVFFCQIETWSLIVQVTYAFIFLQNVLANNFYRENIKHRQKIPERLIVTDEIGKGGHRHYVYKRLSILPTDMLYNSEKVIFFMYTQVTTCSLTIYASNGAFHSNVHSRLYMVSVIFALIDIFLAPIPMGICHVVYPTLFFIFYCIFLKVIYVANYAEIIVELKEKGIAEPTTMNILYCFYCGFMVHTLLVGLVDLRDFIISLLDDSKTPKQQQSLRSQKRLARRRLMKFVEDDEGHIIGITLQESEGPSKAQSSLLLSDRHKKEGSSSSEFEKDEDDVERESEPETFITKEIKPPPPPSYPLDGRASWEKLSSSDSETDRKKKHKNQKELQAIKSIRFPSPPKPKKDAQTGTDAAKKKPSFGRSKIPIPIPFHRVGGEVKPRDSIELIHEKQAPEQKKSREQSPPTPPLIHLVQTTMKLHDAKEKAKAGRAHSLNVKDAESLVSMFPKHYVKLIRTAEERKEKKQMQELKRAEELAKKEHLRKSVAIAKAHKQIATLASTTLADDFPVHHPPGKRGSGDKPIASKVIFLDQAKKEEENDDAPRRSTKDKDFHKELTMKLLQEQHKKNRLSTEKRDHEQHDAHTRQHSLLMHHGQPQPKPHPEPHHQKFGKVKPILVKSKEPLKEEEKKSRSKDRLHKLAERRKERTIYGKKGKPVYDPLVIPEVPNETSFRVLETKLKDKALPGKTELNPEQASIYQKHPGIGTKTLMADDIPVVDGKEGEKTPLVAFHPLVKYYDVNEKQANAPDKEKVGNQPKADKGHPNPPNYRK